MTLRDQIEILVAWQALDLSAAAAEGRIAALSDTFLALDREMDEKKARLDEAVQSLEAEKKQYRALEVESRNYLAMIAKSNDKLRSVNTNKEYQSMLKEIEETQKKHSDLEDRMLEMLESLESMEAGVSAETARLAASEARCREKKQETQNQIQGEQEGLDRLKQKRDKALSTADPKTTAILTAVRKKCHGIAVAPVQQSICMGCHLNIPAQLFNELLRFDEIRFCPHCHRIIYWKEKEVH